MTQCIAEAVRSGFKLGTGTPLPNENMPLKKKEKKKKVKKAPENSTRKLAKDQANISPQGSLKFNLILAESLHTASEWGVLIQPL